MGDSDDVASWGLAQLLRKAERSLSDGTFFPSRSDMGAVREGLRTEARPWGLPLEQK